MNKISIYVLVLHAILMVHVVQARNIIIFNNIPCNVTLRLADKDMFLQSGRVLFLKNFDAEYIEYDTIEESQEKKYKKCYFEKDEVGDQDVLAILYQGFVKDEGRVKKFRKHAGKAKDLPYGVGGLVEVVRFGLSFVEKEEPYILPNECSRVYTYEHLLQSLRQERSAKSDEYLKNRDAIKKLEARKKKKKDKREDEFEAQIVAERLQERQVDDAELKKQIKNLKLCVYAVENMYTTARATFEYNKAIQRKSVLFDNLETKKILQKEDWVLLKKLLADLSKTKKEMNQLVVKWVLEQDLLHESFVSVIEFFERQHAKEYHPDAAKVVEKRDFLPCLTAEIKKCFAKCLLLQQKAKYLKTELNL